MKTDVVEIDYAVTVYQGCDCSRSLVERELRSEVVRVRQDRKASLETNNVRFVILEALEESKSLE